MFGRKTQPSGSSARIDAALARQRADAERKRIIAERIASEEVERVKAAKKEAANAKRRATAVAKRAAAKS